VSALVIWPSPFESTQYGPPIPKNAYAFEMPTVTEVALPCFPFSVVTATLPPCWNAKPPVTKTKLSIDSVSVPAARSRLPVNARSTVDDAPVGIESLPAESCVKSTALPVDALLTCTWIVPPSCRPGMPMRSTAPDALSAR
jgi:hypothetical protein